MTRIVGCGSVKRKSRQMLQEEGSGLDAMSVGFDSSVEMMLSPRLPLLSRR